MDIFLYYVPIHCFLCSTCWAERNSINLGSFASILWGYFCRSNMNLCFNAGSTFNNISHWKPEYPCDPEGAEESSWQDKKSFFCEAYFRFSFAAFTGQIFRPQLWCSCTGRVCAETVSCTRRLPAPNRVLGGQFVMLVLCSLRSDTSFSFRMFMAMYLCLNWSGFLVQWIAPKGGFEPAVLSMKWLYHAGWLSLYQNILS